MIYTGTAVTAKAMRILGYMDWSSGLTTAGTWAIVPTLVQLFGPGISKPGDIVQRAGNEITATSSGTTTIPFDDTIPQNTEGDQYFSQAITPDSAANLLEIKNQALWSTTADAVVTIALFQDSVANAIDVTSDFPNTTDPMLPLYFTHIMLAATASQTTFKIRAGTSSASTLRLNGRSGARVYGGAVRSRLMVREIMA